MQVGRLSVLRVTVCSYFLLVGLGATLLPNSEVGALKEIAATLGKTNWNFSVDPCSGESGWVTSGTTKEFENAVKCECTYASSSVCHVVSIVLKSQSLPGILPPELVKLPYLQQIDLSRNYLNGSIPREWGSMKLVNISLGGNRISGSLPIELANITTLKSFVLEFNFVSGVLPHEFGNLPNIQRMIISSNKFSGPLPETLAKLTTLKDFRINDNHFTGKIPDFIQSWTNIERLAMVGSGLEGPIPSGISFLTKLSDMRICDINSTEAGFPPLTNLKNMIVLVLRSCNITGEIPSYVGDMTNLQTLDLSFNKLTGQIPSNINSLTNSKHIILAGNALTGPVPAMPKHTNNIDLSYNNLTLGSSRSCQEKNINLFKSSSDGNNLTGVVSCLRSFTCPSNLYHSFHINCGGREVIANGSTTYREDTDLSGASTFFSSGYNWGYSSTGTYTETSGIDNYTATNVYGLSMKDNELYTTARLSPLSLTYYGFCLHNGNYTVNLHFAEIMFTNDNTYRSLGRRLFDVYIQGKLVLKDFNIEDEAGGVGIATIKTFTAVVVSASLEIRFYWAGKGTTGIPSKGTYGPLISAISVDADFQPPSKEGKTVSPRTVVGILLSVVCTIVIVLGALWWKGWFQKNEMDEDLRGLDLQTGGFTLKQIKDATNNFDPENKIGEGGFGPVYKGILADGSTIAVKQLSSKSKQGSREFLNEIGMISALQHPNLVKLYGCCTEGNQLLLVYEYMENNSLAHSLFEREESQLKLDWPTRHNICVGLARALTYLHEESRLKIVHRDIKATNLLLDKDLNVKVSDFGLAKLDEENRTHISTRIAGTYGYMAPEYAMRGHLTDKADVYSFGVVVLEMVSGRTNTEYIAKEDCVYLLDWVLRLQERGELLKLVDARLESNYVKEEVLEMIEVALQCINTLPALRPTMSTVVSILEGRSGIEKLVPSMSIPSYDKKSETTNKYLLSGDQNTSEYQTQSMSIDVPWTDSSNYEDLYHANPNTEYWNIRE